MFRVFVHNVKERVKITKFVPDANQSSIAALHARKLIGIISSPF